MRNVNYLIKTCDGHTFKTTDYALATAYGNRILETFLTEVKTEKTKEQIKRYIRRYKKRIERIKSKS